MLFRWIFEFLTNGVLKQTDYDYSSNANDCEANDINGTWKIEGETLKLTNDYTNGQEEIFTIKKLDDTSFEIQQPLPKDVADEYELNVVSLKYVFNRVK